MSAKRILIAVTSHTGSWTLPRKTGYWLGEVTHFYDLVAAAGYSVDIVSPKGGVAPLDVKSRDAFPDSLDAINKKYLANADFMDKLQNTLRPDQVRVSDYVCIYFAGGHGVMWDFTDNAELARIARDIYENGGVVSAVCHGVCGLLPVQLSNGRPLIEGKRLTGFANTEERLLLLRKHVPFLTEDALKAKGARFESALPFAPKVVVDGRLVTGQNPYSAKATARETLKLLAQPARAAS